MRLSQLADDIVNRSRLRRWIRAAARPSFRRACSRNSSYWRRKTILAFAIRHALVHGMDRVIYVIPFTSIIEQNAEKFREALGDDVVVEHHSNFSFPGDDQEPFTQEQYRLQLSTENWDAPLIVTTNVQFYESLFSAKSSRCRRLPTSREAW